MEPVTKPIKFTTHKSLANRLILATLHGRPIHVSQIRASNPTNPGLAPSEISLLRLLESLTNGSHIEISYTGTTLLYKPGLITGSVPGRGADAHGILRHEVDGRVTRGISYLVLAVCLLAPFSKGKVNVLFTGPGVITSAAERWGDVRLPKTVHMLRSGRVKRIRGVAYATGVSGGNNARMIEVARGVLNRLVGDIYIFSDVGNAQLIDSGKEPGEKKKVGLGFGLSLVAESTAPGVIYSADAASGAEGGETPEEVGRRAAYALLESISRGGCISSEAASTVLMLMSMGSEDVGRVQLGRDVLASEEIIQLARDMGAFGTAGWGIRDATEDGVKSEGQLIVSVVGSGIGNVGRKIG
ncbi:hypothetical protein LTR64_001596 [Lithohypha guttulata]|uniref:uncharacterized protein n=1 Tax=Lithohypha guttulata TaxID=1690604 RepID=UPI002DE08F0D|nr:hypothetical protein LTR51_003789 [Lithohypha guttulata]